MKTFTAGVAAGAMAATVGFVGHVSSREFVQSWVGSQMAGRQVAPSWDVRYLAWATSLEMGLGLVLLYALVRRVLPARTSVMRGVLMAGLLLASTGRLLTAAFDEPSHRQSWFGVSVCPSLLCDAATKAIQIVGDLKLAYQRSR